MAMGPGVLPMGAGTGAKTGASGLVIGNRQDDALLAAYGRGDAAAFDELYRRYRDPLYGYLMQSCRDEALAGELFQDVWLRVISSARTYRHRGRFRAWLFTLAHNRLIDHYRKSGRELNGVEGAEPVSERAVERQVEGQQASSAIDAALDEMPVEQRAAFMLREEEGLPLKDIAEIQGVTLEAAKSRLRYAYRRLREALGVNESC